jgi:D-alanyl-D-alanine carboxypeptidase (penicillin-binding protein 5/6)
MLQSSSSLEVVMKRIGAVILICSMLLSFIYPYHTYAQINNALPKKEGEVVAVSAMAQTSLELSSPSAVLIEGSTGTVIFEKNKDERLKPASITKIMTLLLIFEALSAGQISLTDEVSVSEYAASMGGSQVYLEPNEVQSVDTMIKCISIASGNDASVAMAEKIAGSEEEFVARMNKRAKELGMNNTHFVNCCGLDTDDHYSSAYDIALMSRELIMNYPQISNYATVWMDTIVHSTKRGQIEFGLTNTNKMVKFYQGITGLKTGSTSLAKYCLSATARKNDMNLIAVIMAAPDTKTRFLEASKLLNYGFANYSIYKDDNVATVIDPVKVSRGVVDTVQGKAAKEFSYLCTKGISPEGIRKEVVLFEQLEAPIAQDSKIGEIIYYYENDKIGSVDILAAQEVGKAGLKDYFIKVLKRFFVGNKQQKNGK